MRLKNQKRTIIICGVLGFFWVVGYVGNHADWIGCKWNGLSDAIGSARKVMAEKIEKRRMECVRRKLLRERERIARHEAENAKRIACEKEILEREKAAQDAEAARCAELERQKRIDRKLAILKAFAMREAPKLWESISELQTSVAMQIKRERALCQSLEDVGIAATNDVDYLRLVQERKTLESQVAGLWEQLCNAYVESRKYDAEMGFKEREIMKRLLTDDGADEASATASRFERMRQGK